MKRLIAASLALSMLAATGSAFAAPGHHDDRNRYDRHDPRHDHRDDRRGPSHGHAYNAPPKRGGYLPRDHRGSYVRDYHRHGLHAPARGQEWRQVDGRYVLIAAATGLIANVVLNGR